MPTFNRSGVTVTAGRPSEKQAYGAAVTVSHAPSLTAVQLSAAPELSIALRFGVPLRLEAGSRGPIAIFLPDSVVALSVTRGRDFCLFLFRTASPQAVGGTRIAGVQPAVRLFLATSRRTIARRTGNLLSWLAKTDRDPDQLSDAFWARAAAAVEVRRRAPDGFDPFALLAL